MLSYIYTVSSTLNIKEIIYNNHITWCRSYKFGIILSPAKLKWKFVSIIVLAR
jgi:hypothetical protein